MGRAAGEYLLAETGAGPAAAPDLDWDIPPFDCRAATAEFEACVVFLTNVGFAFEFGFAFAAVERFAGLAFAAGFFPAANFGFPRGGCLELAEEFAALVRDTPPGRATVLRFVAAALAVAFFRAAILVLKSALTTCPFGRRSIWRRYLGSK